MADDKKSKTQTKQALLGELESIKTLLDGDSSDLIDFGDDTLIDDELLDPPILTSAVGAEHEADSEEDIPVLTEAFNSIISEIENQDSDEADRETAAEPEFEQWPDSHDDEVLIDDQFDGLDESDNEDGAENEIDGNGNSLFDDLESEFQEHLGIEATPSPARNKNESVESEQQIEAAEKESQTEVPSIPTTASEAETEVFDLDALEDTPPPIESAADPSPTKKRGAREDQPSLFDAPNEDAETESSKTEMVEEKIAAEKKVDSFVTPQQLKSSEPSTSVSNKAAAKTKVENPFLPKHIRDRLHTNRSLQDELTTISSVSNSLNPSQKAASSAISEQEQLIDELVKIYLPKIEAELRQRLKASLEKKPAAKDVN